MPSSSPASSHSLLPGTKAIKARVSISFTDMSFTDYCSLDVDRLLLDSLGQQEEIVWRGRPTAPLFRATDVGTVLLGIVLLFLSLPAIPAILRGAYGSLYSLPMDFMASIVVVIAIGVWLCARPWVAARERSRSLYLLTTRRFVSIRPDRKRAIETWPLGYQRVRTYADGSGDLIFFEGNGGSVQDVPGIAEVCALIDALLEQRRRVMGRESRSKENHDHDIAGASSAPRSLLDRLSALIRDGGGSMLLAIGCLLAAAWFTIEPINQLLHREETQGRVTRVHWKRRTFSWTQYSPQLHYVFTVDGKKYHGQERNSLRLSHLGVKPAGSAISVRYDPEDPTTNSPNTFREYWAWPAMLLLTSLGFFLRASRDLRSWAYIRRRHPQAGTER